MMEEAKIFAGIEKESLEKIQKLMTRKEYKSGEVIFEEGEIGKEFYIIQSGKVDVLKSGVKIGELLKNDVFGEMAVIDNRDRAATIKASEDMITQVITKENFERLKESDMETYLKIVLNITKELSTRLRDIDDKLQRIWKWYLGV